MIKINLLPVRQKQKQEAVQRAVLLFVVGLVLVLGAFGGWYWTRSNALQVVEGQNSRIQREIEDLKKIIGQVDAYKKQEEVLAQKLGVIRRLRANKTGPVHMLDELATHIPDKLWLTSLNQTASGDSCEIEGVSINNEVIATFMSRLDESDYFTEVFLVSIQRTEMQDLKLKEFKITARLVVPDAGSKKGS